MWVFFIKHVVFKINKLGNKALLFLLDPLVTESVYMLFPMRHGVERVQTQEPLHEYLQSYLIISFFRAIVCQYAYNR